jgi:hypothetical protein
MRNTCIDLPGFILTLTMAATSPAGASDQLASAIEFNRDIRPLLSEHCFACHGPDEGQRKAKLRLDVRGAALMKGAIVPGKPNESELVQRILSTDPNVVMPPPKVNKVLSAEQKALLQRWVAEGAQYQSHWAYQTPVRTPLPPVRDTLWPANWIDRFLLARLEREGVPPAGDADRVTLIRRVSFDLTGLPPTPGEVDAFVADRSPMAWEQLIDRLLASDAFGERLAVYWLDLVRFADTVGLHGDQDHNISPYRDWVIDAFNDNMPFDRFTVEQLAGDLLPGAGVDQRIASAYNRLLQTSHEGGVQPKEYLSIYSADHVRNLSAVWLGATMGCAQCHNHKYDPYTAKDFYSMAALFADIDEATHLTKGADRIPTVRPPEIPVLTRRERALAATIEDEAARKAFEKKTARVTMITAATDPRTIRILPRGNWLDDSGPIAQPAVPEFLGKLNTNGRRATRLNLANWLTDPRDGIGLLTARVMANRFWFLFFGQGLARVLDDFGGQGEPPSHPELLDALAHEFVANGWDVKQLIKQIVLSRAYRQTSTASAGLRKCDPENRLLARQAAFRLPAEMIRDNALAVSGLLVRQLGGASVKPYQPDGYYRHLNFPTRTYKHHADQRQWRRGVYVHWQRQYLHPMLKAFDAPSREECTAQRPRSNTPLAALVLLNDPSMLEAARVFAEHTLREDGDPTTRLDSAFRRAVSRAPDAKERQLLTELLARSRDEYAAQPNQARQLIGVGQAPAADDLDAVEWAAWTHVARAILNLAETTTRY